MKTVVISGIVLLSVILFGTIGFMVVGCGLHRPAPQAEFPAEPSDLTAESSSGGWMERTTARQAAVTRVGGDNEVVTDIVDGEFRSGDCRISTPLPEGYPTPTPPGAIELKRYPLVRRAGNGGTMTPDWGMNVAFFPLFNHIKRREIAMTSPVEMNYEGLATEGAEKPSSWTMSFVYRTPQLGAAGIDPKDERVLIEDIPPLTVVAIGMRGPYKMNRVNNGIAQLRAWLSQQPEWEAAGEPRALFYNGPEAPSRDKWSELQIPVRRR